MFRTVAIFLLVIGVATIVAGYVRATSANKCPPPRIMYRYIHPLTNVSASPLPYLAPNSNGTQSLPYSPVVQHEQDILLTSTGKPDFSPPHFTPTPSFPPHRTSSLSDSTGVPHNVLTSAVTNTANRTRLG